MQSTNEPMWLRCEVTEGQLDGEYAVGGDTPDGAGFSLFVPTQFVSVEGEVGSTSIPAWLKVQVLDRAGNQVLVRLPRHSIQNGTTITVRSDDLEPSPLFQDA